MEAASVEVSVVVATRNRVDRLARTLDSLAKQDFDRSFEVVIVDDDSTDSTWHLLASLGDSLGSASLTATRRPVARGPGAARNSGWRLARGSIIAFTDDDCEPARSWLSELVDAAANTSRPLVQGVTVPNPSEKRLESSYTRTLEVRELGPWFPAANVAYPRDLLTRLDGFDESMLRGEDTDLAWRAIEMGANPVLADEAIVHHAVMQIGPAQKLRVAAAWTPAFRNFKRHPRLREVLWKGLFWKRSHGLMLLAAIALPFARRFPPATLLVLPYVRDVRARLRAVDDPSRRAVFLLAHDGVETGAALVGSLKAKTLVL